MDKTATDTSTPDQQERKNGLSDLAYGLEKIRKAASELEDVIYHAKEALDEVAKGEQQVLDALWNLRCIEAEIDALAKPKRR